MEVGEGARRIADIILNNDHAYEMDDCTGEVQGSSFTRGGSTGKGWEQREYQRKLSMYKKDHRFYCRCRDMRTSPTACIREGDAGNVYCRDCSEYRLFSRMRQSHKGANQTAGVDKGQNRAEAEEVKTRIRKRINVSRFREEFQNEYETNGRSIDDKIYFGRSMLYIGAGVISVHSLDRFRYAKYCLDPESENEIAIRFLPQHENGAFKLTGNKSGKCSSYRTSIMSFRKHLRNLGRECSEFEGYARIEGKTEDEDALWLVVKMSET